MTTYTGKYPTRIASVSCFKKGPVHITANDGTRVVLTQEIALANGITKMPQSGEEIGVYAAMVAPAAAPTVDQQIASIESVVCTANANGTARYTAVMADGTHVVLRKQSTRVYPFAFFYDSKAIAKDVSSEIAGRVTFGKAPSAFYRAAKVIRRMAIIKAGSL